MTAATVHRPVEFVLLDSPGIDRSPDANAFAEHFHNEPASAVIEFPNLGKDAVLIVPRPQAAQFPPTAISERYPAGTRRRSTALWALVGAAMQRRINKTPVWLSTAGAGVSWLHLRLDDQPKYYGYDPYRRIDF